MKLFQTSLIASSLALASVAANAADSNMYAVLGMQQSTLDENVSLLSDLGVSVDDNDLGTTFSLGYRLNDFLSFELGYLDLGDILSASYSERVTTSSGSRTLGGDTYTWSNNLEVGGSANINVDGYTFAALFKESLNNDIDIFAKAGIYNWDAKATITAGVTAGTFTKNGVNIAQETVTGDADGTDWFWGLGASYKIDEETALRAEYNRYTLKAFDESGDVESYGLSLVINF